MVHRFLSGQEILHQTPDITTTTYQVSSFLQVSHGEIYHIMLWLSLSPQPQRHTPYIVQMLHFSTLSRPDKSPLLQSTAIHPYETECMKGSIQSSYERITPIENPNPHKHQHKKIQTFVHLPIHAAPNIETLSAVKRLFTGALPLKMGRFVPEMSRP